MSESDQIRVEKDFRKQLDRAHADFEKFVSMAGHNLREPLRDIASYSELMTEKYAGRLDSEADGYLARIQEGVAKAQSLLNRCGGLPGPE